jgi:hypothetical protein
MARLASCIESTRAVVQANLTPSVQLAYTATKEPCLCNFIQWIIRA